MKRRTFLKRSTEGALFTAISPALFGLRDSLVSDILKPTHLTCQWAENPVGIDIKRPVFNWWNPVLGEQNQRQTAYRIQLASDPEMFDKKPFKGWDSGRVECDGQEPAGVFYPGPQLKSLQKIFWRVKTWNSTEIDSSPRATEWSNPAFWTCGLFEEKDWSDAQWIRAEDESVSSPQLRRTLSCDDVSHATIAICGIGLHEIWIDGKRINDEKLAPAYTAYNKTCLYRVYDVSRFLNSGRHTIGVWLGEGWLRQRVKDVWRRSEQPWIGPPRMLFMLNMEHFDGSRKTIISDENWKWKESPLVFADIVGGETWDGRKYDPQWAMNESSKEGWKKVVLTESPGGKLRAQVMPPVRIVNRWNPVSVNTPLPGHHVFDAGKVTAGITSLKLKEKEGTKIKLIHEERLRENGLVNNDFFAKQNPGRFQLDEVICSGKQDNYELRFTYHGFRYLEVNGTAKAPELKDVEFCEVHNDFKPASSFNCSEPMINRLLELIDYSHLCNCHGVPTDCPQREKNPWLYDAYRAGETAMYRFDMHNFYAKWVQDMLDAQEPNGHVPAACPPMHIVRTRPDGSFPLWTDPWYGNGVIRVPWLLYLHYGDKSVLEKAYPAMQKHCEQIQERANKNGGIVNWGLGDWIEPIDVPQGFPKKTPIPLTGTIGLIEAWQNLAKVAQVFQDNDMIQEADQNIKTTKEIWAREFLDDKGKLHENEGRSIAKWRKTYVNSDGIFPEPSQTAAAMTLAFDLCPRESRKEVLQQLLNAIERADGHFFTGFLGLYYLFDVLCDEGYADLAYRIFTKENHPGFKYMIENGATSLWEFWQVFPEFGSLNHPTWGLTGRWIQERLGGISIHEDGPGFRHILLRPVFPEGLDFINMEQETPLGLCKSRWKQNKNSVQWEIHLPPGTKGIMDLSNGWIMENGKEKTLLQSGTHTLRLNRKI